MRRIRFRLLIAALSLSLLAACGGGNEEAADPVNTPDFVAAQDHMDKLWADHMLWTYAVADAFFNEPESLDAKLQRLLRNQQDIGAAFADYYGSPAGAQLAALLTTHIEDAVPVLKDAQAGDKVQLEQDVQAWLANADAIAQLLNTLNPQHWPAADMQAMWETHIRQTVAYAVDLLQQDWAQSITDFDAAYAHMNDMSAQLTQGIARQQPARFLAHGSCTRAAPCSSALSHQMNKLWADHMLWTYVTVDAFYNETGSLDAKLARLLQNQKDIGAAFVPWYGQAAGDQLAGLLTTHITDAVPVLSAAQDGDDAALQQSLNAWYANAAQVAQFMTGLNPGRWPADGSDGMQAMWKMHIDQTVAYSLDLLGKEWPQSVADFDTAFDHMAGVMAQMLAGGIAAQFPAQAVQKQ